MINYKKLALIGLLILGYMLLSYWTDKFLSDYFFNLNDIQRIFE